MRVIRADAMGMCFGVRDALSVLQRIDRPQSVTVHGELVHNEEVLADLDRRGFKRNPEGERQVPATPEVLITAHGISDRERRQLQSAGKRLIDTTCPLVKRVHDVAGELQRRGFKIVVVGKPSHVEVRGITGDLEDPLVVERAEDVRRWPHSRLGIVCQTTAAPSVVTAVVEAVRRHNPHAEVVFEDTVCNPTKQRGVAVEGLLDRVEVLVVVGGRNSNNTRQLVRRAERRGVRAFHVQGPGQLRREWFAGCRTVGLTAGTSTLPSAIEAVAARLEELGRSGRQPLS